MPGWKLKKTSKIIMEVKTVAAWRPFNFLVPGLLLALVVSPWVFCLVLFLGRFGALALARGCLGGSRWFRVVLGFRGFRLSGFNGCPLALGWGFWG